MRFVTEILCDGCNKGGQAVLDATLPTFGRAAEVVVDTLPTAGWTLQPVGVYCGACSKERQVAEEQRRKAAVKEQRRKAAVLKLARRKGEGV